MLDHRQRGLGPKITRNALGLLHGIFDHGRRKGLCSQNPCELVDKPRLERSADVRFLDQAELEALFVHPEDTAYGPGDRTLFLTAAMTGLRQGELPALRWMDVDWAAECVRVRRSYVRGEWGEPKSRRGSRAVPMIGRVAGELERHFQRLAVPADSDLVFPDPHSGGVQDHSYLVRRFKKALKAAGGVRFASTICGTPLGRGWPRQGYQCARFRSGWATATTRPRSSTRTMRQCLGKPSSPSGRSRLGCREIGTLVPRQPGRRSRRRKPTHGKTHFSLPGAVMVGL